jgi:predicted RNase H-like HicB family nuclease
MEDGASYTEAVQNAQTIFGNGLKRRVPTGRKIPEAAEPPSEYGKEPHEEDEKNIYDS